MYSLIGNTHKFRLNILRLRKKDEVFFREKGATGVGAMQCRETTLHAKFALLRRGGDGRSRTYDLYHVKVAL